ncbi:MAG: hypothetical protein ABIZ72_04345, partial [Candidatus Limnocylindrales bacterium]
MARPSAAQADDDAALAADGAGPVGPDRTSARAWDAAEDASDVAAAAAWSAIASASPRRLAAITAQLRSTQSTDTSPARKAGSPTMNRWNGSVVWMP